MKTVYATSDPAAAFLAQQNLVVLSRVGQRMFEIMRMIRSRHCILIAPGLQSKSDVIDLAA